MKLLLNRTIKTEESIISPLTIDGVFECYTLENPDHLTALGPDHTAIACGTYRVKMYASPKFNRRVPILYDVPGHTYVEIHIGNTSKNTHACILVGEGYGDNFITNSTAAFEKLVPKIEAALDAGEEVTITVQGAP